MKRVLFIYYLLGGLLFLLPDRALAQETGNMKAVELTGKGIAYSNQVFDYKKSETRNQFCIPPEVLCLPLGTQIRAISVPYRINLYNGVTLTQSLGNMRIALGEITSMPDYEYPYSYIEEDVNTYYEGSDQLEVTNPSENKYVTYNFSTPFTYQGGCLLVDLKTTTPSPITQDVSISTSCHESEGILNLRGQNGQQYPNGYSVKPDIVLGVTIPSGHAVPYIPLMMREQIVGYAEQYGSSEIIPFNLENLGDQSLTVTGLSSLNFKLVDTPITIPGGALYKIGLQYTPQSVGSHEENVQLQTSAGNIEMKLSGTTYRQAPYSRVVTVSLSNPIWGQLTKEDCAQITELSIEGQVTSNDINFAFTQLPNLTKLDMSAAVSSDERFYAGDNDWTKFEQLALPAGIKNMHLFPAISNLSRLLLPLGFKSLSGEYDPETGGELVPPNLTTLIVLGTNPPSVNKETIQYIETVYVPEKAIDKWKNDYDWKDKEILPITDAVLQPGFGGDVQIRDEQVFTEDAYPMGEVGISIKPDESLVTASAGLRNQAPVQMKELSLSYRLNSRQPEWGESPADGLFLEKGAYSAFINENDQATLQKVSYSLKLQPQKWHFISFPFDVDRNSIISAPENGGKGYVIRQYNGQSRANNGMYSDTNWQDVTEKLSAGCGYILQTDYPEPNYGTYKLSLSIEDNTDAMNQLLNTQQVLIPLNGYSSYNEDDKNWNLIGNPYPSFFNIRHIDFGDASIIVIWDGRRYIPLSIQDDSYSLRPLEAFFVQKPDGQEAISFNQEGRATHDNATESYTLRSASNPDRKVLNLSLSSENYTDRARIVINPSARLGFDMNNDAVKWMSPNEELPQFYTLGDDGKRYAINERPEVNGCIPVGFYAGKAGSYTFKLSPNTECEQVCLIDKYENKQVDLSRTAYSFRADPGTVDDRFEIRLGSGIPASNIPVNAATASLWTEGHTLYIRSDVKADVTIHTASGVQKYRGRLNSSSTTVRLEPGFYLVRINETTHKVIIH